MKKPFTRIVALLLVPVLLGSTLSFADDSLSRAPVVQLPTPSEDFATQALMLGVASVMHHRNFHKQIPFGQTLSQLANRMKPQVKSRTSSWRLAPPETTGRSLVWWKAHRKAVAFTAVLATAFVGFAIGS